jgi:aminoglycoside phosphotransferase (APT) family kinase protein
MSGDLASLLLRSGAVSAGARFIPLTGGVSSEIVRVEDGGRVFVAKRALAKLKVRDDWRADPGRIRHEHLYMTTVAKFLPDAVPRVLQTDDDGGWFSMEWLGEGWRNWKADMLAGRADAEVAGRAGRILGTIHRETRGSEDLRRDFDTTQNFHDLRLDAYLLTTGRRHPGLEVLFRAEADRIRATRECLAHGDYSPKNMLVRGDRLVVLDCEVAWFGDPRFDLAFLLNHLHLKGLHHAPPGKAFTPLVAAAAGAYFAERRLEPEEAAAFDRDVARLLLMLLLARVDGKSPVEYLADAPAKQDFIRRFVADHLTAGPAPLADLTCEWFAALTRII